jgi:hypothetical protein
MAGRGGQAPSYADWIDEKSSGGGRIAPRDGYCFIHPR